MSGEWNCLVKDEVETVVRIVATGSTDATIANATIALVVVGALTFAATAVLAWLAYRTIQENKGLIEAAKDQARSTAESLQSLAEQATATTGQLREMELDRQLDWTPYLAKVSVLPRGKTERVNGIKNIGRGPALNVRLCTRSAGGDRKASTIFHLAVGDIIYLEQQVAALEPAGAWVDGLMADLVKEGANIDVEAFVCFDQLGGQYRFWHQPRKWKADKWSSDDGGEPPVWAQGWPQVEVAKA
jgi:hypothetical protein